MDPSWERAACRSSKRRTRKHCIAWRSGAASSPWSPRCERLASTCGSIAGRSRATKQGGDVHYVTLCGGGLITRIVVADVSGHGSSVAEFSSSLRSLLRKHINNKSQSRLVERLNQEFAEMARLRRFATAVVATYLTSTDELSISQRRASAPAALPGRRRHLVGPDAGIRRTGADSRTSPWDSTTRRITARSA